MGIFNTNMPKEGEIIHGKYGEYVLCNELGHGGNGFVFDIRRISWLRMHIWFLMKEPQ